MKKSAQYVFLAYCLWNFAAVASVTTDLLALRAARTADVTPGVWHSDLNKARAYAEANGLPLFAVWSNGDYCSSCVAFENCVMSPAFQNWMRDSGIVFYFGVNGDNTNDGQEGYRGTSFYWCCKNQNASMSWPYVRVWWPEGDVDECHSGTWYDGAAEGKILRCTYSDNRTDPDNFIYPGDYDTYNPGGRRIISVLVGNAAASAVMPVGGAVTGGLLSRGDIETVGDHDWSFRPKANYVVIDCGGRPIAAVSPLPVGSVEVPAILGGRPVVEIGDWAFSECFELTGVTIPAGVTSIGDRAFYNCNSLSNIVFTGNAPIVGIDAFSSVTSGCTVYVPRGSTGWGVEIPGTWNGLNIQYLTPEVEIALANEAGGGTVEIDGELSNVEVASGVMLVVKGDGLDGNALASKISPKPHEAGQAASLFKVKVESVTGGVSLAVVLDEEAVDSDGTAAEIVDAANIAAFGAVEAGESVPVSLPGAKKGLYYGIAVASDLAGLEDEVTNVSLVRAGEDGVTIPVVKPTGSTAFFKVIVSDRIR